MAVQKIGIGIPLRRSAIHRRHFAILHDFSPRRVIASLSGGLRTFPRVFAKKCSTFRFSYYIAGPGRSAAHVVFCGVRYSLGKFVLIDVGAKEARRTQSNLLRRTTPGHSSATRSDTYSFCVSHVFDNANGKPFPFGKSAAPKVGSSLKLEERRGLSQANTNS